MIDFNKSIYENRVALKRPFIAAHRGTCRANIPCNSLAAYALSIKQGADVVEIDVSISKDGKYYAFHPGTEPIYLEGGKYISDLTSDEVDALHLLNCDRTPTHYKVPTLQETFALLKGKVYINVDKFWTDIKGITEEIYKAGVEKQVIVKTYDNEESWAEVEKYAPDLMYSTMAWHTDTVTPQMKGRNINYIGLEALFDKDTDAVASAEYVKSMYAKKLLVWYNSIIYDEKAIIASTHTDDISLNEDPKLGWGWMVDMDCGFIQTDWVNELKAYLDGLSKK